MPNFLALSLELRDIIYNFVLNAPDDAPPSSPADSGERRQSCEEIFHGCSVYFPQTVHISSAALLLINRQIHAEFAASIARLKKSGRLRYKLDCMLYGEGWIYPTWLSVPVLSEGINVLEVDVRRARNPEGIGGGLMSKREADPDGCDPMIRCLWALLKRFLTRGPKFSSCEKDERRIEVGSLVLNVLDRSHDGEEMICRWDRSGDDDTRIDDIMAMMMHREIGIVEIYDAIRYLVLTYSPPILERLKTLVLREDGWEFQRWNLEAVGP